MINNNKKAYGFAGIRSSACRMLLVLVAGAGCVFGQSAGSATISGTVKDPAGSVVPAADVVVHNTDTGLDRTLQTNGAGLFTAAFLPPGPYEVDVAKTGFAKLVRSGLIVQVGQTVTLDLALQVQTASESVNVSAETPIVDPDKTDVSQVVSAGFVSNLPIAGRRWENFVLLTPNVTTDGDSGLVSYRGISGLYNASSVDGANNNVQLWSETRGRATGIAYVYSQDSIQEFQVSAANYSAEMGGAAGGITNAVTKSGTNKIHGDLFYYLRYPKWNALDPIAKAGAIYSQPVHQQQQFGGSIGAPILRDKLFFFGTYDGSRKASPVIYTSTVTYPLACPAQVSPAACTAANNFLSAQPGAYPRVFRQDTGFMKLDYQLNTRNRISSSYDLVDFQAANAYRSFNTYQNESPLYNGPNITHERIFVTNWDSVISNSTVNNLRFQWGRDLEVTGTNSGAPGVQISNVMQYGTPNALPRYAEPDEHRDQIADTLSITHGTHTFKAGVDLNLIHEVMINLFYGGGVYNYFGTAQSAFSGWVADITGTNLGDGLTGRHWSLFTMSTDPITGKGKDDFWMKDPSGFFEDTWKVRKNLTLTLGMRYEVQLIPQPPRPNLNTPLTTYYSSTINIDSNNFAPRIGASWQLTKGMVLRTGYGIFYAMTPGSAWYNIRVENGVYQQQYGLAPSQIPGLTFPNVIFNPSAPIMPAPFAGALTPQVTLIAPPQAGQIVHGLDPKFVDPLVHEGDVTFEKELPGNMSFTAAYVVSRGLRLPIYIDGNVAPTTVTKTYDVVNSTGATQSTFSVPFYDTTRRLNPSTGVILVGTSDVNSWYNSMVLTFRKNASHGLEFLLNYTLSKSVDGAQTSGQFGTFFGTDVALDPYNKKLEYGISDMDQRHRFVGSAVYAPTFSHISNKSLRTVVNGFSFSTILTAATGQPLSEYTSSYPSGGVDGGFTGAEVGTFATATGGRVPFLPRNNYYLPNLYNVDFRIAREIVVKERYRLALVGEAFNLFNHPLITNVGPGSPPTAFSFSAAGSGVCAGHTNGCVVPNPSFPAPSQATSTIYAPRQIQVSARFSF
jgi:hypothetical protein